MPPTLATLDSAIQTNISIAANYLVYFKEIPENASIVRKHVSNFLWNLLKYIELKLKISFIPSHLDEAVNDHPPLIKELE